MMPEDAPLRDSVHMKKSNLPSRSQFLVSLVLLTLVGCTVDISHYKQEIDQLQRENAELSDRLISTAREHQRTKDELTSAEVQSAELQDIVSDIEQEAASALEKLVRTDEEKARVVVRDQVGHVVGVDLGAARARKSDIAILRGLPYLETANLALPDVNNESLQHLTRMRRLLVLDLQGSGVNDAGVKLLKQIESLQDINLQRTGISDEALAHLNEMPNLKRIRAAQTSIHSKPSSPLCGGGPRWRRTTE